MPDSMIDNGSQSVWKKVGHLTLIVSGYLRFNHVLFAAVFLLAGLGFWLSYELRFDFEVPGRFSAERLLLLPYVAAFKLFTFYLLGVHSTDWRYVGLHDLPRLLLHGLSGSLALLVVRLSAVTLVVPKGVILIDFILSLLIIGGARLGIRYLRELSHAYLLGPRTADTRKVIVIGAGDAGEMIVRELVRNPMSGFRVSALFDDDRNKIGVSIHGVKVVGTVDDVPAFVRKRITHMAIVAIPTATNVQMKRMYNILKDLDISVKTLPSLHELIHGSGKLKQLRDIQISDLLGREEIRIDSRQVEDLIAGKVVMVTGAGGSIGGELCRQVIRRSPERLVLVERSENGLFHIHRQLVEMLNKSQPERIVPILCDVRDRAKVDFEFARVRPDLVLHAAAHKHVPLQELNAAECFRNNVGGIQTLVQAAHRHGAATFLLISTDKAVNPVSVMGASKRVCEIYCQAYGKISPTKFMSVRFGNVLASEGSVLPLFMDQIAKGGPVSVTHPDMERYFMTISEAVTLVLQAAALGKSGQILTLEMGIPIKIVDLVRQLIQLMDKDPEQIPIRFTGMRPGERLTETIYSPNEEVLETGHTKIKALYAPDSDQTWIVDEIDRAVEELGASNDDAHARRILETLVGLSRFAAA